MNKHSFAIGASALCLLLTGCAAGHYQAYQGPSRPDSEQARVYAAAGSNADKHIRIACVDGASTQTFSAGYAASVLLLPGRHYLTLVFFRGERAAGNTVWIDAEAGREYDVKYGYQEQSFRLWLEDRAAKKPVGGLPGSEPAGGSSPAEYKCD